jgi:hypothetical protein
MFKCAGLGEHQYILMLEHELSEKMVTTLNEYLDYLMEDENRESYDTELVGQIHQGQQLKMDQHHPELKEFNHFRCKLTKLYWFIA